VNYEQAEIVAAIKQTVCKGATDAQLRMFIEVCKSTGLNPWLKEIWFVPEKGIIMAARDGYLRVANQNPAFDGMETRVERDDKQVPVKATCTVWRKDRSHPIICEAYFNEYRKSGPVWAQYPSAMISKVAEVLALKRSFTINGCVSEEELGDGSGSVAAAQAVAESKIAGKVPLLGAPEPPAATLEDQLHESIAQAQDSRQRKPYDKFVMYKAIGGMKDRFEKIGQEAQYRACLLRYGAHKRNELPEDDGGNTARKCYKEMSLLVGELEAADAIAREKADAALAAIPEVSKLPDAIKQNIGTQMRSGGILWTVADGEDGYRWQPEIK
jgi:phage recombination protein Bet